MKKTWTLIMGTVALLAVSGCANNDANGGSNNSSASSSAASASQALSTDDDQESTAVTSSTSTSTAASETASSTSAVDSAGTVAEALNQKVDFKQAVAKFQELHPGAAIHDLEWEAEGMYQGQKTKRFKIEGEDAKGEYELTIDAVINTSHDHTDHEDDNDDWQEDQLPLDEVITMEAAAQEAAKHAREGYRLKKIELDEDDGHVIWSVKFNQDRQWQDVKIDAKTGDYLRTAAGDDD